MKHYFKGKNFMTPNVLERGHISKSKQYELSEGRGMSDQPIFGVTIAEYDGQTGHPESKLCFSKSEAWDYIESLKEACHTS